METKVQEALTQRRIIDDLFTKYQPQLGHVWCLISMDWYRLWDHYTAEDTSTLSVGPIDNSSMFEDVLTSTGKITRQLKPGLVEDVDYKKVPLLAWNRLVGWYGLKEDSLPVCRKMINQGINLQRLVLEVYLIELRLRLHQSLPGHFKMASFSKTDTIHTIEKEARRLFGFSVDREVRLWIPYVDRINELLTDSGATLQQQALYSNQLITVEVRNQDGTWPRDGKLIKNESRPVVRQQTNDDDDDDIVNDSSARDQSMHNTNSSTGSYNSSHSLSVKNACTRLHSGGANNAVVVRPVTSKPSVFFDGRRGNVRPGLCGLYNLGNTCYLNSAVQCLSNVTWLTQFLLTTGWDEEGEGIINRSSSSPAYAELVVCYAQLMHKIWSGKYTYAYPRRFRGAMAALRQEYAGNTQHDAQEFLSFLLDGLHQALNRGGRNLQAASTNSSQGCESCHHSEDGKDEDEVGNEEEMELNEDASAEAAWSKHRSLNDSVIIDSFHGQLKSSLICPECNKYSTNFQPFCCLSLSVPSPLPNGGEGARSSPPREVEVTFVPLDVTRKHIKYTLNLSNEAVGADVQSMVSNLSSIPSDQMLVAIVIDHVINKVLSADEKISDVLPTSHDYNTQLYMFETPPKDHNKMAIPVCLQEIRDCGECNDLNVNDFNTAAATETNTSMDTVVSTTTTSTTSACSAGEAANAAEAAVTEAPVTAADDTAKRKSFGVPFFLFLSRDSASLTHTSLQHLIVPSLFRGANIQTVLSILEDTGPASAESRQTDSCSTKLADKISNSCDSFTSPGGLPITSNVEDSEMTDISIGTLPAGPVGKLPDGSSGALPAGLIPSDRLSADLLTLSVDVCLRLCGLFTVSVWNKSREGIPQQGMCVTSDGVNENTTEVTNFHLSEDSCISVNWKTNNKKRIYDQFCNGASHSVEKCKAPVRKEEKSEVTLSDCLDLFVSAEMLGDSDVWSCPGCKKQQRAVIQLTLQRLPPVLIIHLKRFLYTIQLRGKLVTPVQFPIRGLDMTPWLASSSSSETNGKSNIYDLISVSNHHGLIGAGHYTAFARSREDSEWYCYDDTDVRKISEKQVVTPDAYILIYERRECAEDKGSESMNNCT